MEKTFVGIDISKDWLDLCVCKDSSKQTIAIERIDNERKAIAMLIKQQIKIYKDQQLFWCFEHTGRYGLLLSLLLEQFGQVYYAVPAVEIQRSLGLQRGKDDVVDAKRIALYAAVNHYKLTPSLLPGKELHAVKQLLNYRALLIKSRTQYKNSLKNYQTVKEVTPPTIIKKLKKQIEGLNKDIEDVEAQISEEITKNQDLELNFKLASSVKGVGLLIAAYLLVYTNNFQQFDNPRKFACYSGTAPFESSSGSSIRGKTKTNQFRNKIMKTMLFSGANSAIKCDPQLKAYYIRKKLENKPHNSIINAVACKMLYRVFATVKRQSNYIVLQH